MGHIPDNRCLCFNNPFGKSCFCNLVILNEFPEITFKSTSVKFKGKDAATVKGDLTILGVTKSVTLNVDNISCGTNPFSKKPTCGFNATTKVKRSDFGMKYGLPAIGDDIAIRLEAEGVRQ